ncbi:MAG: hypothetical protein IE889_04765, partial [Campylobacterales bacterium]|nr:hypothetical protein [Campylobacterales bacterium]
MSNRYDRVPVACDNCECRDAQNCLRYEAWEAKAKERVKTFNGTKEKGCGKFISRTQ